jgi:hypothetical protein
MNEYRGWASGWRPAALGIVIGLIGFCVAKTFLAGLSPSRVVVMAIGFLGIGVSFGMTLLWSTLTLDRAPYKKSGVRRGLMGTCSPSDNSHATGDGVNWLIWIAGIVTLALMRMANMRRR